MVVSEDFRCRTDDHPADTTGLLADGDGVNCFHELRIADNAVLIRFNPHRAREARRGVSRLRRTGRFATH